jgi:hypothetical protein
MVKRSQPGHPCELPREALYAKSYRAALLGDGCVLPIEERLGRRLLRTIEPASSEGRRLLGSGQVSLRHEADDWTTTIRDALDRLERKARESFPREASDERCRLEATLSAIRQRRLDYCD